jgi:hypothetical protein
MAISTAFPPAITSTGAGASVVAWMGVLPGVLISKVAGLFGKQ